MGKNFDSVEAYVWDMWATDELCNVHDDTQDALAKMLRYAYEAGKAAAIAKAAK